MRTMKIAVMGMGVAGSYLLSRLKDDHEVTGYERMTKDRHDSICAWGSSKSRMTQLCEMSGIDFGKYVIHDGKFMHISCAGKKFNIALHGLCTYDKIGLIQDLVKNCTVHYGKAPAKSEIESKYDLIVDCTGFHRSYLPRIKNDFFLPTYEYKVQYEDKVPYDDFFVHAFKGMSGYFWYFPLGEKTAHIGAGDYNKNHVIETNKFLKKTRRQNHQNRGQTHTACNTGKLHAIFGRQHSGGGRVHRNRVSVARGGHNSKHGMC